MSYFCHKDMQIISLRLWDLLILWVYWIWLVYSHKHFLIYHANMKFKQTSHQTRNKLVRQKTLQDSTGKISCEEILGAGSTHIWHEVLQLWQAKRMTLVQNVLESVGQWLASTDRQACVSLAMVLEIWRLLKPGPNIKASLKVLLLMGINAVSWAPSSSS